MVKDSYRFALVTQDEKLLKTIDHRSRYLNQIRPPLLHGAGLMVGRLKCSSRGLGLSPVAGSLCYVLKQNSPCLSPTRCKNVNCQENLKKFRGVEPFGVRDGVICNGQASIYKCTKSKVTFSHFLI